MRYKIKNLIEVQIQGKAMLCKTIHTLVCFPKPTIERNKFPSPSQEIYLPHNGITGMIRTTALVIKSDRNEGVRFENDLLEAPLARPLKMPRSSA